MGLVLGHLKEDPGVVWVALSVILGESLASLLTVAAGIVPSWGLWQKPGTEQDDRWEHDLEPNWNNPGSISTFVVESTASCSGSNESSNWPHDVVKTRNDSAISWVRDLDDVGWACSSNNADSETEEETSTHELTHSVATNVGACALDNYTDNNDYCCDGHASSTSPGVEGRANERESHNRADLVHGGDDTSPCSIILDIKKSLEVVVGQ